MASRASCMLLAERVVQRARARRPAHRSVLARCMTGRCFWQSSHELVRREIAEARVWTHLVVVAPPSLDDHLRLGTRTKPFEVQALVAELAVEALRDAILPRLARLDQCRADALSDDPGKQRLGHDLRPVVTAQEARRATSAHQARQHVDDSRRANASVDVDRQPLLGELVGDGEALELLPVGAMVEYKIIRPHLVRPRGRLRARPCCCHALAWPLAWQLQAGRAPEPVGPADAHAMPIAAEKDADAGIAIARIVRRQVPQPLDHTRVLHRLAALVAQRRSCHREQRAGPSYRETTLPAIRNLTPTSRHAHQFFAATSFITSISRSRSATSFFSRAFSASSCFSRRTSFDCN